MQRDGREKMNGTPSESAYTQKNMLFTTLVVEGEGAYAGELENFLKAEGHYVLRADSAEKALSMTTQHWPDLILLNKEMNGADGLSFLPELLLTHPSAAVIMMATKPSITEAVDAMTLGAVDYLERPLNLKRLKQTIDAQKALYTLLG